MEEGIKGRSLKFWDIHQELSKFLFLLGTVPDIHCTELIVMHWAVSWQRNNDGLFQILHGRFSYGPFDMSVLSGEKVSGIVTRLLDSFIDFLNQVDIHVMKEPPSGEWTFLATALTDKTGRITYKVNNKVIFISWECSPGQIPETERLGYGVYPVKMVVRGDHTLLGTTLLSSEIFSSFVSFQPNKWRWFPPELK